jgi:hypothetical protein
MLRQLLVRTLLLLALSCFYQESFAQDKKKQIKIVGRVVAIDDSISVTGLPLSRDLIIRIVKRMEGDEQTSYIKVVYQPLHGQKELPKEMWGSNGEWLFTLQRATDDDEICNEPVKGWVRTKLETGQAVPDFEKLTCYLLSPDGFKRH